jgi:ADP-heptose:LPS heptosyltransferase
LHPLERYQRQLNSAGVESGPLMPDLSWVRGALRDPPRLQPDYFGLRGRFLLLLPRGADAEPQRRWPEAKYVEIARRAAQNGVTPVVLGGEAERAVAAAIAKAEPRARNLVTRADLFQMIALMERATLAVGDDVDLMHVAAAAGAPCVVFLSALNKPEQAAPRGPGGVVILTAAVVGDLTVEQVERQMRNCGVYAFAATA